MVGMYQIRLLFSSLDSSKDRERLKEYGRFRVAIYERSRSGSSIYNINLCNDKRFKNQYWTELNKDYNLRIKNLIDIIMYVKRLNNLKMFL
jgi:hypothetical protein